VSHLITKGYEAKTVITRGMGGFRYLLVGGWREVLRFSSFITQRLLFSSRVP
jgi:hypothetical protein